MERTKYIYIIDEMYFVRSFLVALSKKYAII